jgi:hypothetical protein
MSMTDELPPPVRDEKNCYLCGRPTNYGLYLELIHAEQIRPLIAAANR